MFLLFKKRDVKDPTNYRPISLLNANYKIISSHTNSCPSKTLIKHQLLNHTEIGGVANRPTSDHIYRVTQHILKFKVGYNMYIDFNKAFNSVPREGLWKIMSQLGITAEWIATIKNFYTHPVDFPRILLHTMFLHIRQRCVSRLPPFPASLCHLLERCPLLP